MSDHSPPTMWSLKRVAERDGVTVAAISKTVKKLIEKGLDVERDGRGRISSIAVAQYDHLRGQYTNPAKQPPRPVERLSVAASDSFEEARRQNEWLKVEREKLRRQEELKQLVRVDSLVAALETVGREIRSVVDRLPNQADELALASAREGIHGMRTKLRDVAFELNRAIADSLAGVAAAAPNTEAVVEESADA